MMSKIFEIHEKHKSEQVRGEFDAVSALGPREPITPGYQWGYWRGLFKMRAECAFLAYLMENGWKNADYL